jgi:hypothetical protein
VDLIPYLSAIILISTIATVLLAIISYAAFKLRDKRKPKQAAAAPVFFRRYVPSSSPAEAGATDGAQSPAA